MSFADSPVQQRQTTTAVYKAVLVDFGDYTNDDLKECLLPPPQSPSNSSTSSTSSSSTTTTTKLRQLLSGSVLGVIAAVLGLLWLAHSRDSAAQQHNQQPQEQHYPPLTIFWFALVWSSATAITAFCVFNATMRRFSYSATSTTTTTNNKQQSDEYSFALGVFAGFCATCTAHDATHGVPITSLLVTAGLALFWGLLMACSARGGGGDGVAEEEEEEEETCTPRRGTHLPMISFVV